MTIFFVVTQIIFYMSQFTIRQATVEDGLSIAVVYIDSWKTTYSGIITEEYFNTGNMSVEFKKNQWINNIKDKSSIVLVFEDSNRCVGLLLRNIKNF